MFERKDTWPESLSLYLDRVRDNRFEWGSFDCAIFACGAIHAVTGKDITTDFKDAYQDWRGAAIWLKSNGYRSFADAVSDRLGDQIHPAMAGRGDIVMRRSGNGNILGVCVGKHAWFLGDEVIGYDPDHKPIYQATLVSWPTLQCDKAWKV